MDANSSENNADSSEETRSKEIQNLKTYLQERFGKLPVLPGDPRSIQENNCDFKNCISTNCSEDSGSGSLQAHPCLESKYNQVEGIKKLDGETVTAVSALARVANSGGPEYFRQPKTKCKTFLDQDKAFVKDESDLSACDKKGRVGARSVRFTYAPHQVDALVTAFNINPYPTRLDRENLECMLGLSAERIKNWFQNRRSKERRKAKQNNTPLPTPILMRDMGQGAHITYPGPPHMLHYMRPRLPPPNPDHTHGILRQYLKNRLPSARSPHEPPHTPRPMGDSHLMTYKPNWTVPWHAYAFQVARTTTPSTTPLPSAVYGIANSWQNSANHWPPYYDNRCMQYKAHTVTSDSSHTTDNLWSAAPPVLSARPSGFPHPVNRASSTPGKSYEECLASSRPHSRMTWYEDVDRPVDVNSVDDTGEESLPLEDSSASAYNIGDTSQSDTSSYRSLLDDSAHVDSTVHPVSQPSFSQPSFPPLNNQQLLDTTSQYPVLPLVSMPNSNGHYINYSPVSPPLAQDLDGASPTGLDGYHVFSLSSAAPPSFSAKDLSSPGHELESDSSELDDEDTDESQ